MLFETGFRKLIFIFIASLGFSSTGSVENSTFSVPFSVGNTWEFSAKAGINKNGIKNKTQRTFNMSIFLN